MFRQAIPVFAEGKEWEKNTRVLLRSTLNFTETATLRIAAASFYRLFINGSFICFGPARAAKGYSRVDEISLDGLLKNNINEIIIEIAGYACRSLSLAYERSFVCAEIECGGKILLATGRDFDMYISAHTIRQTERYSVQRQFGEIYDMRNSNVFDEKYHVKAVSVTSPRFLPRGIPFPIYDTSYAQNVCAHGLFEYSETLKSYKNRYSFPPDERWGTFTENEIPYKPFRWVQKLVQTITKKDIALPLLLRAGEYAIFDLSKIETGFLTYEAECLDECDIVIAFSELCENEIFEFTDINCQNVIEYLLPKGKHKSISFEPYALRYAAIFVKSGAITVNNLGVIKYERDMHGARTMQTNDPVLQKIYDAAISTFAHNALDLYTDCPSRERAGWLCDSYFTAKAEHFFFGKNVLEEAFLENYRMYEYDGELPRGVLPMCYPSCIENNGKFIPQWNMWYILEVCEFLCERQTEADKELFRESVMGIINFLSSYENELGLLENLPSWNFVEWSAANNWVNDVNFPTNFLYAEVLSSAFTLYGDASMLDKAKKIRQSSVSLSFNGEVFCDNAVRVNGILVPTKNTSEACQYYAALFGGIDVDKPEYAILKTYILNGFSGFEAAYPMRPFVPVNAFIGRYLRIMTLIKMKEYEILLDNIRSFFGGMSERTGTLWEYKQNKGSLDHGFASYAAAAISEALEALHSKSKI